MKRSILLFLTIILFSCNKHAENPGEIEPGTFLNDWEYQFYLEEPNENAFKLWIPNGVTPKAVLVLSPGNATDGRHLINDAKWQAYANKENLAIIGAYVRSNTDVASDNLLTALEKICGRNNIEYVAKLPILLRGFSHGGVFSYRFAEKYPTRTLAYANIKGNLPEVSTQLPPGLLIVGGKDLETRNRSIKNNFLAQRKLGSIVCYALEQNGFHSIGDTDDLVRAFFTSVLKKRLDNNSIKNIDETTLFLGNISTLQSYEYSNYPDKKEEASCLIDEEFKVSWINFVK